MVYVLLCLILCVPLTHIKLVCLVLIDVNVEVVIYRRGVDRARTLIIINVATSDLLNRFRLGDCGRLLKRLLL